MYTPYANNSFDGEYYLSLPLEQIHLMSSERLCDHFDSPRSPPQYLQVAGIIQMTQLLNTFLFTDICWQKHQTQNTDPYVTACELQCEL
jgi:hypothetical protein